MKANKHEKNGYIYVTSEEILIGKNVFDKHRKEILFCENKENLDFFKLTPTRYFGIILCNNPNLSIQQLTTEEVEYLKSVDSFEVRKEKYSERFDNDKSAIGNPATWGNRYKILIPQESEKPKESNFTSRYQELFNYLHDLGVITLESELQEIERIVLKQHKKQ